MSLKYSKFIFTILLCYEDSNNMLLHRSLTRNISKIFLQQKILSLLEGIEDLRIVIVISM